jgi:hypothetical protein
MQANLLRKWLGTCHWVVGVHRHLHKALVGLMHIHMQKIVHSLSPSSHFDSL